MEDKDLGFAGCFWRRTEPLVGIEMRLVDMSDNFSTGSPGLYKFLAILHRIAELNYNWLSVPLKNTLDKSKMTFDQVDRSIDLANSTIEIVDGAFYKSLSNNRSARD